MRFAIPFALLVLSLLPAPAAAGLLDPKGPPIDEYTIDLQGRYWFGQISGEVDADTRSIPGTDVDFEDNLGFERPTDPLIEGVLHAKLWKVLIRAAYTQVRFEEDVRLEESIRYKGLTFTVGDDIEAEALIRFAGLDVNALLVDVGNAQTIGLEVGVGIGLRYLSFYGSIEESLGGLRASTSRHGVFPVVSACATVSFLNIFQIGIEAGGMKVPSFFWRIEGTFLDAAVEARAYLFKYVYVCGGYRYILLKSEWDFGADIEIAGRLQGFYVGVGVSF